MQKTANYQLNQWDAGDAVRRTDFNEDNAKIDAAIKAMEQSAAQAVSALEQSTAQSLTSVRQDAAGALAAYKTTNDAAVAALQSAVNTADFVIGSYTGDGTANRTITVGFTPKFLIQLGKYNDSAAVSFVTSEACRYITSTSCSLNRNTVFVSNGFETGKTHSALHNTSGCTEYYIAFR